MVFYFYSDFMKILLNLMKGEKNLLPAGSCMSCIVMPYDIYHIKMFFYFLSDFIKILLSLMKGEKNTWFLYVLYMCRST